MAEILEINTDIGGTINIADLIENPLRLQTNFWEPVPDMQKAPGKLVRFSNLSRGRGMQFLDFMADACLHIHQTIQTHEGPQYSIFAYQTLIGLLPELPGESFNKHEEAHLDEAERQGGDLSKSVMTFGFMPQQSTNLLLPVINISLNNKFTPRQHVMIAMAPVNPSYMDTLTAIGTVKTSGYPQSERRELYDLIRGKVGMGRPELWMWLSRIQMKPGNE